MSHNPVSDAVHFSDFVSSDRDSGAAELFALRGTTALVETLGSSQLRNPVCAPMRKAFVTAFVAAAVFHSAGPAINGADAIGHQSSLPLSDR